MQLSDFDASQNLLSLFFARAAELGDKAFLWTKRDGAWQPLSWTAAADRVCLLAESLVRLGLEPGDRVLLVSENRPEWCLADLAIMAAGYVTVPTYTSNTERDHAHVLENSGASAVIVSDAKLAKVLLPAALNSECLEHVIAMSPLNVQQSGTLDFHQWDDLLTGNVAAARKAVKARVAGIARSDLACIIYTSGTGGSPRGVMQHHGSILRNIDGAARVIAEDLGWGDEVFLSFLPLSHAYEHSGGQFLPIGMGAEIYYAEGLEKLASNIEEVRPTIMVVVPRLFEVLRTRIINQVNKQGALARYFMQRAMEIGIRSTSETERLRDRPMDLLLERLFRPKIRTKFGGRIKALVSGGAPLNPEVGAFFHAVGLLLLQGYGQTEAGPIVSCNCPSVGIKLDTVGPPLPGVEVKIAGDGEILLRGECVMLGYWKNPKETKKAIQKGWLHTGDIGHIDAKGRIVITDRKKDMIVNDKGDNVAPQRLEGMLTLQPEIAQAMVTGDARPYVVALLVPDAEWALEWAQAAGKKFDIKALQGLPEFRSAVREGVDRVNRELSVIEKIRQFAFADEAFTTENAEMTPSLKIRRHKLKERYGDRLDGLYKG